MYQKTKQKTKKPTEMVNDTNNENSKILETACHFYKTVFNYHII